jgi:hypothetical protein
VNRAASYTVFASWGSFGWAIARDNQ